jgi:hypothetical protein
MARSGARQTDQADAEPQDNADKAFNRSGSMLMGRTSRVMRYIGAVFVVVVLALAISGTGLYFLMRSEAIENSALSQRIEANIQNLFGPSLTLEMNRTKVGFDRDGLLSLVSNNVRLMRSSDQKVLSTAGQIVIGIRPLSLLFDEPKIDAVIVENSTLNASLAGALFGSTAPQDLDELIDMTGKRMESLHDQFVNSRFRLFQFRNLHLTDVPAGLYGNGQESRTLSIENFDLRRKGTRRLQLEALLNTELSRITLMGEYYRSQEDGSSLSLDLQGLHAGEWARAPADDTGPVGSDAIIDLKADIPFSAQKGKLPKIVLQTAGESVLRLGRNGRTPLRELTLNFSILRDKNQIELDPSTLRAGRFRARLVGGLKPAPGGKGLAGDWIYELIANPARPQPTLIGEKSQDAAIKFGGRFTRDSRVLLVDEILGVIGEDRITGTAQFGFHGKTPSVTASVRSNGLDISTVKQFWPFFLGPPARDWVQNHVVGGRITDISVEADIPPGIVGRFRHGAKMQPDEFTLRAAFSGARFDTFGDLPAIRQASGTIAMDGMKLTVSAEDAIAYVPPHEPAKISQAIFTISDIGIRPNPAEIKLPVSGNVAALASIADKQPLRLFQRLNLDPVAVSGTAHADIAAKFRLKRGLVQDEVEWHAIVNLESAGSKQRIFEHMISDANVLVDANPEVVRISGNAVVDGTRTRLEITEPIGASQIAAERNFSASLDNNARQKMGLALDNVIDGPIEVNVEQVDQNTQKQTIDLQNAQITLPWIGWVKGKEIPATASFVMERNDKITELKDFYIEGEGFSAAGTLAFDPEGVLSADFTNISLNARDSFSLFLNRENSVYNISVSGVRMDARGLLNKLFHEGGFGEEQGTTNVRLTANLGEVRGFNDRIVRNFSMSYGTRDGWFDNLSLRGGFSDDSYVNLFATTREGKTTFEIDSTDAGATLSFADIYRRMNGGMLRAQLTRQNGGAFIGPVRATNFTVTDEPRLKSLVSNSSHTHAERGQTIKQFRESLSEVNTKSVRFREAKAIIEKDEKLFRVDDGVLSSAQIGFTFDGLIYDEQNRMNLSGTFLPAMGLSRAIGFIPLVGELLGNGRDSGLIGITFRMRGPSRNPQLDVNPISVVAPGIFRKVFEYRN